MAQNQSQAHANDTADQKATTSATQQQDQGQAASASGTVVSDDSGRRSNIARGDREASPDQGFEIDDAVYYAFDPYTIHKADLDEKTNKWRYKLKDPKGIVTIEWIPEKEIKPRKT